MVFATYCLRAASPATKGVARSPRASSISARPPWQTMPWATRSATSFPGGVAPKSDGSLQQARIPFPRRASVFGRPTFRSRLHAAACFPHRRRTLQCHLPRRRSRRCLHAHLRRHHRRRPLRRRHHLLHRLIHRHRVTADFGRATLMSTSLKRHITLPRSSKSRTSISRTAARSLR